MDKLLPLVMSTVVLLGGCASTKQPTNPDLLRTVNYVGGGWYVAAINTKHKTFVHAKELEKTQETYAHTYPDGRILSSYAFMRNWDIRLVNSSESAVCVDLSFLEVDYSIDIIDDWFIVEPLSTEYIGTLNQMPLQTTERIFAYPDAKWAVDVMKVVPYMLPEGCKTKE